jgi:hypothetical protein
VPEFNDGLGVGVECGDRGRHAAREGTPRQAAKRSGDRCHHEGRQGTGSTCPANRPLPLPPLGRTLHRYCHRERKAGPLPALVSDLEKRELDTVIEDERSS